MRDYELYAQAFFESCSDNPIMYYQSFTELCHALQDFPKHMDFNLFDVSRPEKVNKFFWVIIQDGMLSQIEEIRSGIRSVMIEKGVYNYCVIESAQKLKESTLKRIKELVDARNLAYTEYELRINLNLKAGLRILFNDEVIDLSVAGRLEKLLSGVSHG